MRSLYVGARERVRKALHVWAPPNFLFPFTRFGSGRPVKGSLD